MFCKLVVHIALRLVKFCSASYVTFLCDASLNLQVGIKWVLHFIGPVWIFNHYTGLSYHLHRTLIKVFVVTIISGKIEYVRYTCMWHFLFCWVFQLANYLCRSNHFVCCSAISMPVVQLACTIHCSWILDVRSLCKYAYSNSTSKILSSPVPISCQCRCEQAFDISKCVHVQVVNLCLQLSILFSHHIPLWIHTFIQAIHKVMFWSSQLSMLLLCRDHSLWL